MVTCGTALEGGEGLYLDAGGGGREAKCLGDGRVRTYCIHELVHRNL